MDFFQDILESILLDMARAQDRSNRFSARLAACYEHPDEHHKPPALSFFPVPNAAIDTFSFTLRFGIEEIPEFFGSGLAVPIASAVRALGEHLAGGAPPIAAADGSAEDTRPDPERVQIENEVSQLMYRKCLSTSMDTCLDLENRAVEIGTAVHGLIVEWLGKGSAPALKLVINVIRGPVLLALSNLQCQTRPGTHYRAMFAANPPAIEIEQRCSITVNVGMRAFQLGLTDDSEKSAHLVRTA